MDEEFIISGARKLDNEQKQNESDKFLLFLKLFIHY